MSWLKSLNECRLKGDSTSAPPKRGSIWAKEPLMQCYMVPLMFLHGITKVYEYVASAATSRKTGHKKCIIPDSGASSRSVHTNLQRDWQILMMEIRLHQSRGSLCTVVCAVQTSSVLPAVLRLLTESAGERESRGVYLCSWKVGSYFHYISNILVFESNALHYSLQHKSNVSAPTTRMKIVWTALT